MKRIIVATDIRQIHLSNVYESKSAAKENADMGYVPVQVGEHNGQEVNGWMNYSKHGYQEDRVENAY